MISSRKPFGLSSLRVAHLIETGWTNLSQPVETSWTPIAENVPKKPKIGDF
jgi:hypothetical protein